MITPARFEIARDEWRTVGNKWKRERRRGRKDFLDWRKPIPSKIGIDGNVGVEISLDWKSREREREERSTSNAGDVSWVFLEEEWGNLERIRCFSILRFFNIVSDVLINEENVGRRERGKGKRNRSSIASRESGSWRSTIAFHEIWNFYRL